MKSSLNDLARFGGTPEFPTPLHVGRPNLGDPDRLFERFRDIMDRRWFTNDGECVREMEGRIAELLGVRHCVAVANGTVGLEIAIRACGLSGEVIVPSFTFVATAHALHWMGMTPVFCDSDPVTHNLDPRRLSKLVTPRTSGIIGVHLWGRPCPVKEIAEVAARHDLRVLYDAAHAFACTAGGRMIGGFGDAEVFSFHATKFFSTFEGGAITTDDAGLAERARLMRNFGFAGYDQVVAAGTNGKMNEFSAAMGLTSLESLDDFIDRNRRNHRAYSGALGDVPGVTVLPYDADESGNYQYVVLEVDEVRAGLGRDEVLELLHAENVLARRYFYPCCHRMEPYRTLFPDAGASLGNAEAISERVLSLPTGTTVTESEIERICGIIRLAMGQAPTVRKMLGGTEAG